MTVSKSRMATTTAGNAYLVVAPRTDEVRRHRPEDLREDLAVLARGVVPQVVRGFDQRVGDHPVLLLPRLIVVGDRYGAHERVRAIVQTAPLRRDEAEMLCVQLLSRATLGTGCGRNTYPCKASDGASLQSDPPGTARRPCSIRSCPHLRQQERSRSRRRPVACTMSVPTI